MSTPPPAPSPVVYGAGTPDGVPAGRDAAAASSSGFFFTPQQQAQSPHPSFGRGVAGKAGQKFAPDPKNTSLPPIPLRPDGRRKRVHPTRGQQALLEAYFAENSKPNSKERAEICAAVNINSKSVQLCLELGCLPAVPFSVLLRKIWFQNRRAKAKKTGNAPVDSGTLSSDTPKASSRSHSPSNQFSSRLPAPNDFAHSNTRAGDEDIPDTSFNTNTSNNSNSTSPTSAGQFPNIHSGITSGLQPPEILWTTANGCTRIFTSELNIGLLRWAVVEASYTFKMEIPLVSVLDVSINPVPGSPIMSIITLDIGSIPAFYRELRDQNQSSPTGLFVHCSDFTENMAATHCLRHVLQGSSIEMEKLFLMLSDYFNATVPLQPQPQQPQIQHHHQPNDMPLSGHVVSAELPTSMPESVWFTAPRTEDQYSSSLPASDHLEA
ncbi:hypothetical protein HDU83_007363 [Entophlyctis luteolus]|nr:hypothetical protein HDU83_007363 [Entophlyctis luteolus]